MEHALVAGDHLVARRREPRRGEVVVFEHPPRSGFFLVKRVVALGGEVVDITDGTVIVNGSPCDPLGGLLHTEPSGHWRVPDHACFVLSDARTATAADSRTLGPVLTDSMWVVVFRSWPPGRIGTDFRPLA